MVGVGAGVLDPGPLWGIENGALMMLRRDVWLRHQFGGQIQRQRRWCRSRRRWCWSLRLNPLVSRQRPGTTARRLRLRAPIAPASLPVGVIEPIEIGLLPVHLARFLSGRTGFRGHRFAGHQDQEQSGGQRDHHAPPFTISSSASRLSAISGSLLTSCARSTAWIERQIVLYFSASAICSSRTE